MGGTTWYCVRCGKKQPGNPRWCPWCGYTVYRPEYGDRDDGNERGAQEPAPIPPEDACVECGADAGGEGYCDDCATPDEIVDLARKTVQLGPAGRVARFALDQAEGRTPRPL